MEHARPNASFMMGIEIPSLKSGPERGPENNKIGLPDETHHLVWDSYRSREESPGIEA